MPQKLDVAVAMPDKIDISSLRGAGIQPGVMDCMESGCFFRFSVTQFVVEP